jgi:hypothetical protein
VSTGETGSKKSDMKTCALCKELEVSHYFASGPQVRTL